MIEYDAWGDPIHDCTASLDHACPVCGLRVVRMVPAPPDDSEWW